jgi:phage tail P2-like protein
MRNLEDISLLELLPPSIAGNQDIQAAAAAIDAELKKTTALIPSLSIIQQLVQRKITEKTLIDELAWQYHVDFYNPAPGSENWPLQVLLELTAKSLDWHTRKGTPSAVEEIVTAVFGDAIVEEWFEYGGEPHYFKILSENYHVTQDIINEFLRLLDAVKRCSSWLEEIEYVARPQGICTSYAAVAAVGIMQEITVEVQVYGLD